MVLIGLSKNSLTFSDSSFSLLATSVPRGADWRRDSGICIYYTVFPVPTFLLKDSKLLSSSITSFFARDVIVSNPNSSSKYS